MNNQITSHSYLIDEILKYLGIENTRSICLYVYPSINDTATFTVYLLLNNNKSNINNNNVQLIVYRQIIYYKEVIWMTSRLL